MNDNCKLDNNHISTIDISKKRHELISVIVPVYNVENYLRKCIDSIINQTYNNLEIILIDDGSIDNSGNICDDYKLKDDRIVIIHQVNQGLSCARNVGLNICKGNYVCFIDSDDYLEHNMIEILKNNMDKFNSDISCCNFYMKNNDDVSPKINEDEKVEFSVKDKDKFITMEYKYSPLTYYAWNKLYKKDLFNNIRFPQGRIYEYSYILCDIFDKAEIISFTLQPLYYYVFRNSSLGNFFSIEHFDKIGSFDKKIAFLENKKYFDLAIKEKNSKSTAIISYLVKMKINRIDNSELYDKYYFELIKTINSMSWKDLIFKNRLFRLFKRCYIKMVYYFYFMKSI